MARFQSGWLQKKPRKSGDIWVFCYRRQRPEDGAWVQATPIKVGKVRDYRSEKQPGGEWKNSISILTNHLSVANYYNHAAIGVWYKPRQCFCHR